MGFSQDKCSEELSGLLDFESDLRQDSVLELILFSNFTADLSALDHTTVASFLDDIGIVAVDDDPTKASAKLQLGWT